MKFFVPVQFKIFRCRIWAKSIGMNSKYLELYMEDVLQYFGISIYISIWPINSNDSASWHDKFPPATQSAVQVTKQMRYVCA